MGVSRLNLDTTATIVLASTNVMPVLLSTPTQTGFHPETGPAATPVTLANLATFFAANVGPVRAIGTLPQVSLADVTTDATNKSGGSAVLHFTNSEEPVGLIMADVTTSTSTVRIGGGNAVLNAPTLVVINTAANNTTVNGTTRWSINSAGQETLGGVPGNSTTRTRLTKAVASIADATATAILTATVPNATHRATIRVTVCGALGAGGAVGAGEAYGTISYDYIIGRFAGTATTLVASSAFGSAVSLTAGGATITVTTAAGDLVGANSASQTFTIKATITKGSGASDNHTATVLCEVLNASATGITVA